MRTSRCTHRPAIVCATLVSAVRSHLAIWMLAALAPLAIAAPAHAATVTVSGTTVVYHAAAGEANRVTPVVSGGEISVQEFSNAAMTAGPGCAGGGAIVRCPAAGVRELILRLGDGDDEIEHASRFVQLTEDVHLRAEGGSGDDLLKGTRYGDLLSGGSGNDLVAGVGGKDRLIGGGGNDHIEGQGTLEGGPGNDLLNAVVEGFAVRSRIFGGRGNDRVISNNGLRDVIDCGAGRRDSAGVTDNSFGGRKLDTIRRNCESGSR